MILEQYHFNGLVIDYGQKNSNCYVSNLKISKRIVTPSFQIFEEPEDGFPDAGNCVQ